MKKNYIFLILATFLLLGCFSNEINKTMNSKAVIKTNLGVMEFKLFDKLVPKTVENFKKLSKEEFYNTQRFHRVIDGFMIQGGDPLTKEVNNQAMWGTGGPGYTIPDEFVMELRHSKKGVLSMANSGPNTGGSQFFITLAPTPWLNDKHTIFGEITKGAEVLEKIGNSQTGNKDIPIKDIIIEKITIS